MESLIEDISNLDLEVQANRQNVASRIQAMIEQARTVTSYKAPKPQIFQGGRNAIIARDWLDDLEGYCTQTNLPLDRWTGAAFDYLRGSARSWFRTAGLSRQTPWENFKSAFQIEFKPSDHERNILIELRDLKQISINDITNYIHRFRDLAFQLENPSDDMLREYFIAGLITQTQVQVQIANPTTWNEAISSAERINGVFSRALSKEKSVPIMAHNQSPQPRHIELPPGEPMELDNLQRPLKKLSLAERDRLRRIGACFRCRRTGHMASRCRSKTALNNIEPEETPGNQGKDGGEL